MANKISNHFTNEPKEYIPWSYKMNYHQTKKIWNSKDLSARIIKGSGLGIAALAIAETFYEIALMHLKFIGNVFHLYEKNIFKKYANYKIIEIDLPIEQKKSSILKRIFLISLKLSTAGALGYGGYRLLKHFNYISKDISILNEINAILSKLSAYGATLFKTATSVIDPKESLFKEHHFAFGSGLDDMCEAPTNTQCFWNDARFLKIVEEFTKIQKDFPTQ
ncbi:MAG: hypothetical protein JXA94_03280 [Parachlamydiales bacterium]|nr:hypothetical protein [Parachlamydiales bacterium]